VLAAAAGARPAKANSERRCGKVDGHAVRVAKGWTLCKTARQVAADYLDQADDCGQANAGEPACRVGRWHCWLGSAGDQAEHNLISFCFVPKRGANTSFWQPRRFKAAIKIGKVR